jgi:hypothetical protein
MNVTSISDVLQHHVYDKPKQIRRPQTGMMVVSVIKEIFSQTT